MGSWFTIANTFGVLSASVTASDTYTPDDNSLLGLVAETTGFVWATGAGNTVHRWGLAEFPRANAENESHYIALFLFPEFLEELIGTHI